MASDETPQDAPQDEQVEQVAPPVGDGITDDTAAIAAGGTPQASPERANPVEAEVPARDQEAAVDEASAPAPDAAYADEQPIGDIPAPAIDLGATPVPPTPTQPSPGVSVPQASTIIDSSLPADQQPGPDPEQAEAAQRAAEWQAEQDRLAHQRLIGATAPADEQPPADGGALPSHGGGIE